MTTPEGKTPKGTGEERRAFWQLWGAGAGALGIVAHLLTDPQGDLTTAQRRGGAEVVDLVDRGLYHVGAVTGFLAVGCLLLAAVGWRRFAERNSGGSLAAGLVPVALVASAGAMIVGYGFKGTMAIYLEGGVNEGEFPAEGLYPLFMINDLGPFLAWQGVTLAAAALSWLSLRDRLLPRWVGVVSALAFLAPIGFLLATGLTGFPGVAGPLWLVIVSLGLAPRHSEPEIV